MEYARVMLSYLIAFLCLGGNGWTAENTGGAEAGKPEG